MKLLIISLAVLCVIVCAEAQRRGSSGHSVGGGRPPTFGSSWQGRGRFRRSPQGSVVVQGTQPLGGPNRSPSLDINYNHRIIDNDRTKLDAFGGGNLQNGRFAPQAGFGVEHRFKNNIFVHGQGQVQPGHRGRLSPSFGVGAGWRFRREAIPYEEEEAVEEEVY